jgi:hypothetical protein
MVARGQEHNRKNNICIEKIIFSRTSMPFSIKLGTNHPWSNRIKNCPNEMPGFHPRGDNHKNAKIG